jgi:hypothetical protein
MAGRNHVVPIFPATRLISHGFRLWFVVLSLVLNVTEVRCHVGLASHSNTAEGRISERFFSWLPRRNEPKDGSLYHTFPKSFRMTNRTSYYWCYDLSMEKVIARRSRHRIYTLDVAVLGCRSDPSSFRLERRKRSGIGFGPGMDGAKMLRIGPSETLLLLLETRGSYCCKYLHSIGGSFELRTFY